MKVINSDILIVGGGAAGFAAAVRVAEMGLKATIVEKNHYLGGKATAAEVGTICGLYLFSKDTESKFIIKGFVQSFALELQLKSNTTALHNTQGMHYLPYDINAYRLLCEEYLKKHAIEVCYNTTIEKVDVIDSKINAVSGKIKSENITFTFKYIIDCSGQSIISELAKLPLQKAEQFQAAAQVFTIENIEEVEEDKLGLILMRAIKSAIDENRLLPYYDRTYVVQGSVKNNTVSIKIGIPIEVTYLNDNVIEIKDKALEMVNTLFSFLTTSVSIFKNSRVNHIADEVGFRVGKRPVGEYILTEEDVLSCKKFDNAIANGSWPIEKWGMDKRVKMDYFDLDDFYQIPSGCLKSPAISNLFFAGRNISANDNAIASARVIGTCLQTGYAAGALSAAKILDIREADIVENIKSTLT